VPLEPLCHKGLARLRVHLLLRLRNGQPVKRQPPLPRQYSKNLPEAVCPVSPKTWLSSAARLPAGTADRHKPSTTSRLLKRRTLNKPGLDLVDMLCLLASLKRFARNPETALIKINLKS